MHKENIIGVRLDDNQKELILQAAKMDDRPLSVFIRKAAMDKAKEMEK